MSNNLGRTEVGASQNQKEVTINNADGRLDAAFTEFSTVDLSAGNATISNAVYQQNFLLRLDGATVAGRTVTLPTIKRLIIIESLASSTESVDIVVGTTTIAVPSEESRLIYTDGTANGAVAVGGGTGGGGGSFTGLSDTPGNYTGLAGRLLQVNSGESALEFFQAAYDVGGAFGGVPGNSEVVFQFVFPRAVTIPQDGTLSTGKAGVAATAQTDFDLQKEGVSFGTMRFAASGTTASFIVASATSFAAGEEIRVVGPSSADATLADLVFTFAGLR